MVKLAVKNGGKISIKDAKKVETSIKDNYGQGNLGELYGVKISSSDNPKNFDSDWITKDGVDGYFSLYDVKSYLIAFVNVGNGY